MAELKSGDNGANNPPISTDSAGLAILPQSGSKVPGKSPPCKEPRDEDNADPNDDFEFSDEDNCVLLLSEVGNVFMETAFKNKIRKC